MWSYGDIEDTLSSTDLVVTLTYAQKDNATRTHEVELAYDFGQVLVGRVTISDN